MTNPKKMVEKLIQSAKDAEYQAYSDVKEAIALLQEYFDACSENGRKAKKGKRTKKQCSRLIACC